MIATACSKPPAGRARWTLELLADEAVKLTEHGRAIPRDGAPQACKKTTSSPGAGTCGASPRSMPSTSPAWRTCLIFTSEAPDLTCIELPEIKLDQAVDANAVRKTLGLGRIFRDGRG